MTGSWYEVWTNEHFEKPYVLILREEASGSLVVTDPLLKYEKVFECQSYEDAKNWLREDEFMMVKGRVTDDPGY